MFKVNRPDKFILRMFVFLAGLSVKSLNIAISENPWALAEFLGSLEFDSGKDEAGVSWRIIIT